MRTLTIVLTLLLLLLLAAIAEGGNGEIRQREMVRIPAGSVLPLYGQSADRAQVDAFRVDRYPVTRADFLAFVSANPQWRRSEARRIFIGPDYLGDWAGDLSFGPAEQGSRPVTRVSWFAARAYCEWEGKRLPTVNEWEYLAVASEEERDAGGDPAFLQRLMELQSLRQPDAAVGSGFTNAFGVADIHGLVHEWTLDFNSSLVADDSRGTKGRRRDLFCAAGVVTATDPTNYPAFLRYAYRAGLDGRTTTGNLGFRCAASL